MSEKLQRPWIRLVVLFYTFPLPSHFSIFFFPFSLGLGHVPWLSVEMSGYWSHLKSVCMCVTLWKCVSGTSCICHAFALSVTMLSGAYLTGLNPCPPWPIASTLAHHPPQSLTCYEVKSSFIFWSSQSHIQRTANHTQPYSAQTRIDLFAVCSGVVNKYKWTVDNSFI